ncbi:MAG TPA: galactokinase family protein [Longimicrobiales bacterium]|nr:galactokinase family protein [Longimicrobiales bacterium]
MAGSYFVPGRIEVLGKHTDYAGGRSLLAAVNRGFVIGSVPRDDDVVRVIDSTRRQQVEYDSNAAVRGEAPAWAAYPLAVLRRCERNFPHARGGADIAFASDLPQAAGLSSSSALVVATFLALDAVRQMSRSAEYLDAITGQEDLAGYLGAVENGMSFRTLEGHAGVGTMGGSEDHTAILCARPGRLVQYRYAPVRFEGEVLLPAGWTFAIASSGVRAEKAGGAMTRYNELSAATRRLVQLWQAAGAGGEDTLGGIVTQHPDASLQMREIVRRDAPAEAEMLLTRLAQFVAESEDIVPGASAALGRGDIRGFGEFVRRSQHCAVQALRNQIPETMHLVETALTSGAAAASAFGAGFGGSVWALVREEGARDVLSTWRAAYVSRFPQWNDSSEFFISTAAAPAARLTPEAT